MPPVLGHADLEDTAAYVGDERPMRSHQRTGHGPRSTSPGRAPVYAAPAWRYFWPIVRFIQRRADPDQAAASCTALVNAPVSDIDGRYFDGRKPHAFPGTVLDPDLRERVLQLGQDLADRTAG